LPAHLVEARHADLLDLSLAADPEPLLRLDLHRQPVRVPPGDARDMTPAHRLVAADQILDRATDDVMNARPAVRRRRAFEEDERLTTRRRLEGPEEQRFVPPLLKERFFQLRSARRIRRI